jgi:uncharacterized protein DUF1360
VYSRAERVQILTGRVKIEGESCSEQRRCFEREGTATGHLRRLRGQEAEALLLRHADRSFQPDLAGFLLGAKSLGRTIPERVEAKDIALLGVATHKLSTIGAQDAITSPLRAPFTELQEMESQKNVEERPRGEGLRRSIGELLTCQFCLGMWVASFFTYGLILAPRVTRLIATILTILTVSDHLHQTYKALLKRA